MNEWLSFYEPAFLQQEKATDWLFTLKEKAWTQLSQLGFPSIKQEAWKYTKVDALLEGRFSVASPRDQNEKASLAEDWEPHFLIKNGQVFPKKALPEGVIVVSLLEGAVLHHADKLKPYLGALLPLDHGFQALNTALLQSGLFIYVPENLVLAEPLVIAHEQTERQAVYNRFVVVAKPNSAFRLIETYTGTKELAYFTNTVTELFIEAQAKVDHYKLQKESEAAYHYGGLFIAQEENSQLNSHVFQMGGHWVRMEVELCFKAEGAKALLNGIYLLNHKGQHVDQQLKVDHAVSACQSQQNYKGILSAPARAVFGGKILVARGAQKTEAKQENKNLLLCALAEVDTKPQLEIDADDVVCTHGATVGQLDEDALFYLATRGIDKDLAIQYLIRAFMAENIQWISEPLLSQRMSNLLDEHLG